MTPKQLDTILLVVPFTVGYAIVMQYIKEIHVPDYIRTCLNCINFLYWDFWYLYTISHS